MNQIIDEKVLTDYKLVLMKRRTLSIQIMPDLSIVVKAPLNTPYETINKFVARHKKWIFNMLITMQKRPDYEVDIDIDKIKVEALKYLTDLTNFYANKMNLYPKGIKITSAKSRFGSCSSNNSICYSYRLMLYPEKARDYVVVHELAHIKYKNHGTNFYKLIESYLPDYKERIKLLR